MGWLADGVNDPLIAVRAIHFAATAITVGALIFRIVVVEPALRSAPAVIVLVRGQILRVAWIGLATAAASGILWVLLLAAEMSGLSFSEAMSADVLLTVLNETQFGLVSEIRLPFAIVLAICLVYDRIPWMRWPALASALGLIAAIAWTGHAASTMGPTGWLHLIADMLHLVASAAWIGSLVPLALLLTAARRHNDHEWMSIARDATQRFSTLGILSVGALIATGIVNVWILVGSLHALLVTGYGRILMFKVALFAAMLVIAAANRFWLTPRLALLPGSTSQLNALRQLTRNSVVEIVLGLTIFAIVGALGTLHPAIHLVELQY
ncbi:putative copper resistance protein D [Nitrobacteraceae bacterium AZCC 2146]